MTEDAVTTAPAHPGPDDEPAKAGLLTRRIALGIALAAAGLGAILVFGQFRSYYDDIVKPNYLVIHSLAELFSVLVAWGIFTLAWNSRRVLQNNYLLFVGVAYLFVGALDLVHTLAYKGMGVFPGIAGRANPTTQLWIAARYMEGFSLLVAPLMFDRKARVRLWLGLYAAVAAAAVMSIFYWKNFPVCFDDAPGGGLTAFKKVSEYVICGLLLAAAGLLIVRRRRFERIVLWWIVASILVTVAEELVFTLYKDSLYGPANLIGHYLKIVSFYLIYRAVIRTGLTQPQMLLFRDLKQSEQSLQTAREDLEHRVRDRTAQLQRTVEGLQGEVRERMLAEDSLRESRARLDEAQRIVHLGNWDWDTAANQVWWSDEVYRILGLIPRQFDASVEGFLARVHPDDRPLLERAIRDAVASGAPREVDHRIIRPDGSVRWVHQHAAVAREVDGKPVRFIGTVQDVTDRKRLEEQVLDVSELERQRIGQDLHDTVGQALTGAAYLSGALKDGLADAGAPQAEDAARIERILNETTAQARAIARGLCPVQTEGQGLATALVELGSDIQEVYGVDCTVDCDDSIHISDPTVATHLYRITQEAVSNALRHARAKSIAIGLTRDGAAVCLSVRDDGTGLPDDHRDSTGIGLHIMRYRADMIGGSLQLRAADGGGTIVECILQTVGGDG